MPIRNLLVLLAVSLSASAATDPLCAPLRAFAASIKPGQDHELVFRTAWGSGFKDTQDEGVFYAKRCEGASYKEAEPVCASLMKEASVEFANLNAMRAITCLSPKTRFAGRTAFEHGEFTLMYGNEQRGANITLTFEPDDKVGGMALHILAKGY